MPYDNGFRRGGGYDRGFRPESGAHGYDHGYLRGDARGRRALYERPWVGGYRGDEYQGGSGGHAVGTSGWLSPDRTIAGRGPDTGESAYDRHFREDRARMGARRRPRGESGAGELGFGARGYDRGFGRGYDRGFGAYGGGGGGAGDYGGDYGPGQGRTPGWPRHF